jgi:stress response protein YsnF
MIVPLLEEVLVVEKRLVLKEELRITKRQHKTRKPQRVTLRSEEVRVEHLDSSEQQRGKDKGEQPTSAASSK